MTNPNHPHPSQPPGDDHSLPSAELQDAAYLDSSVLEAMPAVRRNEWISAYLDGEVTPLQAQAITGWLDGNPTALREVEHQRRMWDLLETYPDEPVAEGFAERVLARAEIGPRATTGRVLKMAWYRRPLAAAAALLLAFGGGALLWSLRPAPVTPAEAPTLMALEALDGTMLSDDGMLEVLVGLDDETFDRYLAGDFDDLSIQDAAEDAVEDQG